MIRKGLLLAVQVSQVLRDVEESLSRLKSVRRLAVPSATLVLMELNLKVTGRERLSVK